MHATRILHLCTARKASRRWFLPAPDKTSFPNARPAPHCADPATVFTCQSQTRPAPCHPCVPPLSEAIARGAKTEATEAGSPTVLIRLR